MLWAIPEGMAASVFLTLFFQAFAAERYIIPLHTVPNSLYGAAARKRV